MIRALRRWGADFTVQTVRDGLHGEAAQETAADLLADPLRAGWAAFRGAVDGDGREGHESNGTAHLGRWLPALREQEAAGLPPPRADRILELPVSVSPADFEAALARSVPIRIRGLLDACPEVTARWQFDRLADAVGNLKVKVSEGKRREE